MENLTGRAGIADRFVVTQAGSTIAGFNYAEGDRIIIRTEGAATSETVTNFDLINPLANVIAGYPSALTATAAGVEVRIPDFDGLGSQSFVTINTADQASATELARSLANSSSLGPNTLSTATTPGASAFVVQSKGNTVVEWNDITVDAGRMAGVPPAASTRYFALVHTAIYDAVQGIAGVAGRQTYLQSQGINVPPPPAGANADVAAAAAGRTILSLLFTDSNNPVGNLAFTPSGGTATTVRAFYPGLFTAALNGKVDEQRDAGASQASIDAGIAYGTAVARALLGSRQTDGYLLNADGTQVNLAEIGASYRDGIENTGVGEARSAGRNGTVGILSNGTSLVGTAASISTINSSGAAAITSTAGTTPGAWRRAEDTLNTAGQFSGLASPEVASVNKTWFLPTPTFLNDVLGSPPALDTQRYSGSIAEARAEGSLLDIPGTGDVMVNNRSVTVNGVTTSIAGLSVLGARVNDTDTADVSYNNVGPDAPPNISRTQPDGIGTTSAERTIIGHVWANAEGSYAPNVAYQKVAQQLAINNAANESLAESAYRFASLETVLADGFATLWDAKWDKDYFWRPVSAVRNADQLTSTASLDDNTWTPKEPTPQHPCHPSGTSTTAGLATTVLTRFYGENPIGGFTVSADVAANSSRLATALTDTNGDGRTDVNGVPLEEVSRNYTSFTQAREETRLSRIYAGAHFRFATERGVQLGTNVANYFLDNNPFLTPSNTPAAAGVFRAASAVEAQGQARWLSSGGGNYEFGYVTVDNSAGTINGVAVGNAAYAETALSRKNILFDGNSDAGAGAVRNANLSNLGTSESQSAGQLASANLAGNTIFYLTENGVTTFSNSGGDRFSSSSVGGLNQLSFRDSRNQDVRFEVGAAFPAYRSAGAPGATTNVAVSISRAAALNDTVGLYLVDDAQGCFDTNADGFVDLRVGQQGYLQEALRRAALTPAITQALTNNTSASSNVTINAGSSYGLLLVADGTVAQARAAGSTLNVFSSFTGANTDERNHVVRLGNGTTEVFGFEDRIGGGDNDFNDLIVSITRAA
jgi:hypothetical protein